MEKGLLLLDKTLLRQLTLPALNKWTKLDPVISQCTLLVLFCGVIPAAMQNKVDPKGVLDNDPPDDDSGQSSGAEVGAPRDKNKFYRKIEKKGKVKAFRFLTHPDTSHLLLLWLAVCGPILRVHYRLFNEATWFSHRPKSSARIGGIYDFVRTSDNAGASAIACVAGMLLEPTGKGREGWQHLFHRAGEPTQWPVKLFSQARVVLLMTLCLSWRYLVHSWQRFPWRLVPLGDSAYSEAEREQVARKFMNTPPCCLDVGMSLPLQEEARDWQDLMKPEMRSFLHAIFLRAVVTSTFVERLFAPLTRWSSTRQGPASLAAKHVIAVFTGVVHRWRRLQHTGSPKLESHRCRPHWLKPLRKGSRLNGFQVFRAEFLKQKCRPLSGFRQEALDAWVNLPSDERKAFKHTAQAMRKVAATQPSSLERVVEQHLQGHEEGHGVWQSASQSSPWPLATGPLRELLAGRGAFARVSKEWLQERSTIAEADPTFPDTVQQAEPCYEGRCLLELSPAGQGAARAMNRILQLALRHCPDFEYGLPVLEFQEPAGLCEYMVVGHRSFGRPVEATFCRLVPTIEGDSGILTVEAASGVDDEAVWPIFETETGLPHRLAQRSPSIWALTWLHTQPGPRLRDFTVVSRTEIVQQDLIAQEEARLEAARLLRTCKMMNKQPCKRPCPSRRRKASARAAEDDDPAEDPADGLSGEEDEDEDTEGGDVEWEAALDAQQSAQKHQPQHDRVEQPEVSGSQAASSSAVPAAARAPPMGRAFAWGPFSIAKIFSGGTHVGYGATCGRHHDMEKSIATPCKKAVTFGKAAQLSEAECILRLKRWLVAGMEQEAQWGEEKRTEHVRLGGLGLAEFADGPDEASLEELLQLLRT